MRYSFPIYLINRIIYIDISQNILRIVNILFFGRSLFSLSFRVYIVR